MIQIRRPKIGYLPAYFNIPEYCYVVAAILCVVTLIVMRRVGLSLLIAYLFLVLAVTVFLRNYSEEPNIILEPFHSYREYYINDFTWFEIRANVLLFVPIGFLLPMTFKKPLFSFVTGVMVSVMIELLQFVLHRGLCETDDVISNTIGLVIGMAAYAAVIMIVRLFRRIIR